MKNEIKAFVKKTLTSRKFWAALAACMPFALAQDWDSFATVLMAYAGIQGGVDAAEGLRKSAPHEAVPEESD